MEVREASVDVRERSNILMNGDRHLCVECRVAHALQPALREKWPRPFLIALVHRIYYTGNRESPAG